MKDIVFILISLTLYSCSTTPTNDVIPRTWLEKETSLEEYFEEDYSLCLELSRRVKTNCVKGSGNPFEHELNEGYKVYRYSTPKEYWNSFRGHRGVALEIDGVIVETRTTTIQ